MEKKNITNRLFDIAWIIFLAAQYAAFTAWYALCGSGLKVWAYKGAVGLSCALCAAVIIINLVKKVYPLKTFICYAVLGIIFAGSWYFGRNTLLIWMFLLFMAAYEQKAQRVIFISAVLTAAALIIPVVCSNLGLAVNYVFDGFGSRPRYSLGYVWTTNGPTLLFFFVMQWIYLRREKTKVWEYAILEAANIYFFIMTDTKLPFLLISAVLIFFAVQGLFKNHWKYLGHLNVLYYILPAVITAATLVLYLTFTRDIAWMEGFDSFLNNRLQFGKQGIETFGITPFGQQITWYGLSITGLKGEYNFVDCSYILILLNNGVLFLAASVAIYTRMMFRAVKAKDYYLVFIIFIVFVHSFTEPRLMDMSFNALPVLAFLKLGTQPFLFSKKHIASKDE